MGTGRCQSMTGVTLTLFCGRVHAMEEQLRDQESRAEQRFQEELRKHQELLSKLEREKNGEIEMLTNR
ncbi:hypothetical protein chiPu_0032257 [Chiloscyllium punctatum]|uniref:Rab11-FIP3/4 domain-containing protein n=1 Tax=Chiloscyllium punctatum TaxID=137246 RepID=A0A401TZY9_CHIPU|nr:hypothetical protein [Chiloscyllium punctatum]